MSLSGASTKILVLGESGVGKSTLVRSICGEPNSSPSSTVGCSVGVAWHERSSPSGSAELMELWDVGGQPAHRNAATVFLDGATGVILVHDLTNSKSEANLAHWLALLTKDCRSSSAVTGSLAVELQACHLPVLVVGVKADLTNRRGTRSLPLDQMLVDARAEIRPGSTQAVQLSRFFESALARQHSSAAAVGQNERRRRLVMDTTN